MKSFSNIDSLCVSVLLIQKGALNVKSMKSKPAKKLDRRDF